VPSKDFNRSVFLNVPHDAGYERLFVALVASVVGLGKIPHCALEFPDYGSGRLEKIFQLLKSCRHSVHDLSRLGGPARFNMPFELGLVCALQRTDARYRYAVFERRAHRLDRTLSDLKGRDPFIHSGTATGMVNAVFAALGERRNTLGLRAVREVDRKLLAVARRLKAEYGEPSVFTRTIFLELCTAATELCSQKQHLIGP